jgi:hypothetical protein
MNIKSKTKVVVSLGLVLGLCSPVWSANSEKAVPNAKVVSTDPAGNPLFAILKPVLAGAEIGPQAPDNRCKPSRIYTQHDVVGDPETCEMSRYNFGMAP